MFTVAANADEARPDSIRRAEKSPLSMALEHAARISQTTEKAKDTAGQLADYPLQKIDPRPLGALIDEVTGIATDAALKAEAQISTGMTAEPSAWKEPSAKKEPSANKEPSAR